MDFFFDICKMLCLEQKPLFLYIGNESLDCEEIGADNAKKNGFDSFQWSFFDDKEKQKLMRWYEENYLKRSTYERIRKFRGGRVLGELLKKLLSFGRK